MELLPEERTALPLLLLERVELLPEERVELLLLEERVELLVVFREPLDERVWATEPGAANRDNTKVSVVANVIILLITYQF